MASYHSFHRIGKIESYTDIGKDGEHKRKLLIEDKDGNIIAHIMLHSDNKESLNLPETENIGGN